MNTHTDVSPSNGHIHRAACSIVISSDYLIWIFDYT